MLQVAPILTDSGESLQIRALSGEQIIFTRMKIGSGTLPSGQSGKSLNDLITPKLSFNLNSIEVGANYAKMIGSFDTTDISSDFNWTEFGLFCAGSKEEKFSGDGTTTTFTLTEKPDAVALAKVGGTVVTVSAYNKTTGVVTLDSAPASGTNNVVITYPDSAEQLYGYSYDANAGRIRANVSDALAIQVIECIVAVGDADSVIAVLSDSALYARKEDFDDHVNDASNPHNVTKSQVGLGNVPNVATNDQTPTYSAASSPANLTSGEKLSVAFGKLAASVSALISHLANHTNPHAVTYAQAGAAAASHSHAVADITGVLPVSKGGTGSNSVDTAPTSGSARMVTSGGVYAALGGKANSSHSHNVTDLTGVLSVDKGGTGSAAVDYAPAEGSPRMVTSGGIYTALTGKADTTHYHDDRYTKTTELTTLLGGKANSSHSHAASDVSSGVLPVARGGTGSGSVDNAPTSGSTRMVTSGGVYTALAGKANSAHSHDAGDIGSGTLPVARGGTGAGTAADARTNLGLKNGATLTFTYENGNLYIT